MEAYMKNRYTNEELKRALDMVEEGYSFQEAVYEVPNLNKSIIAREMRKRKNKKADAQIEEYLKSLK